VEHGSKKAKNPVQSGRNLIKSRKNTVVDKIVIMRRNRFLLNIKSYILLLSCYFSYPVSGTELGKKNKFGTDLRQI
jgi:hypothetical protein